MKRIAITGFLCLGTLAMAQSVHFDYDRSANFNSYRTYTWVDAKGIRETSQLMDQNIKRAVDSQLAGKGLQRVESGGDLQVTYHTALTQEKQFDGFAMGPRWMGGTARVTSSTIETGKLVVDMVDPARKQLVWRGAAEKTLDVNSNPDKNYRNLERATAKLFKSYPPGAAR